VKLVIVDDSEICRETVRDMVEEAGHEIIALDSPFGLTRTIQQEHPDLVLVDVQMPALRGDQLVSVVVKHRTYRCPLVLHSDRPEPELQKLVASSGADGYICKTNNSGMFLRQLARFVQAA
jgi:DNA-binding response OmpR family regulator